MKILFLGDVVGISGCSKIKKDLLNQIEKNKINFVIVNGENADETGVGLTKEICENFSHIHTISRLKEIEIIKKLEYKGDFFIQMNLDNDPNKSGINEKILNKILHNCIEKNIFPSGLMTIPNIKSDPKNIYSRMQKINNDIKKEYDFYKGELSMGMSGDYEVALDYGATIVRIGTKLFNNV